MPLFSFEIRVYDMIAILFLGILIGFLIGRLSSGRNAGRLIHIEKGADQPYMLVELSENIRLKNNSRIYLKVDWPQK